MQNQCVVSLCCGSHKKSFVVWKKQLCGKLVKAVLTIHLREVLLVGGWGGWCTVESSCLSELFFQIVRSDVQNHCNQTLYGSALSWGGGGGAVSHRQHMLLFSGLMY